MESTRDARRLVDREIQKGSAPLVFDHLEYGRDALQEITSESKLKMVLAYLLRIAEFKDLAGGMTRNNVYTENRLIGGERYHRLNNGHERNANYMSIMKNARQWVPEYGGKTFVETVSCFFSFPEEELEKYRFDYKGNATYAFPLSGRHIINGLYLQGLISRKGLAGGEPPDDLRLPHEFQIYRLESIRKVLFQCLLLDDMHRAGGLFEAKMHTIYLLE